METKRKLFVLSFIFFIGFHCLCLNSVKAQSKKAEPPKQKTDVSSPFLEYWKIRYQSENGSGSDRIPVVEMNDGAYALIPLETYLGLLGYKIDQIDEVHNTVVAGFSTTAWGGSSLYKIMQTQEQQMSDKLKQRSINELNRQITGYNELVQQYNSLLFYSQRLIQDIETIIPYFDYQLQFSQQISVWKPVISSFETMNVISAYNRADLKLETPEPAPPSLYPYQFFR